MSINEPTGLATLPPDLRRFGLQLLAVLRADERVSGVWAIGSLARGEADRWSDIDLLVAVHTERFAALAEDWQSFLDGITPTVFAQRLGADGKPTITAITQEWHRFDITLASDTDQRPHGYVAKPLFIRAGASIPFTFITTAVQVDNKRLATLINHFLRVLGLLPVIIGREEWIVGLSPVGILRDALIDLYLLENGVVRGGAKRLNSLLTDEQRQTLEALPPLTPTQGSIIANHQAIARLFLATARRLAETYDLEYPDRFERATLDHLMRSLDLTF